MSILTSHRYMTLLSSFPLSALQKQSIGGTLHNRAEIHNLPAVSQIVRVSCMKHVREITKVMYLKVAKVNYLYVNCAAGLHRFFGLFTYGI